MYRPTAKQLEAYLALRDPTVSEVFFGGGAGGGKSWLAAESAMIMCMSVPGARVGVGRTNITDTRESFLITFAKVAEANGFKDYSITRDGISFKNGSAIRLIDLTYYPYRDPNFDKIGSKEYTYCIIEEAGDTRQEAFEVLRVRVGRHLNKDYGIPGKILVTFNPSNNWLYSYIYQRRDALPPHIRYIHALAVDNTELPTQYFDLLDNISDASIRMRLRDGNWDYWKTSNTVVDIDALEACFSSSYRQAGAKYITADIAMQGADKFVVCAWEGLSLLEIVSIAKSDGRQVVSTITRLAQKHAVPVKNIAYDGDGVGAYLGGYLRGAREVHNNASPVALKLGRDAYKMQYQNLRAQMYWAFAELIEQGKVNLSATPEPMRENIMREFACINKVVRPDGKLSITPKADIASVIGGSPDFADALVMRAVFEFSPARSFTRTVAA
jgi:phage terminase large subunit